jgi:uncharacterized YigZ family protein
MSHELFTVTDFSTAQYKERGSKFIAYLYPAANETVAAAKPAELKKEYPDATHICYAWKFGNQTKAADAGEPAYSAGAPILRMLLSHKLTHVILLVVRYFGGVKLGVPGLIAAYGNAAEMAIAANTTVVKYIPYKIIQLNFEYSLAGYIERLLGRFGAKTLKSEYTEKILLEIQLAERYLDTFLNMISNREIMIDVTAQFKVIQ